MKNGFTLVELAIVLVIIGLLIGGILVAQSMISTTRILKVIKEIEQYQIAGRNFKSAYKELPGDCHQCSSYFNIGGDGDGKINTNSEALYAWQHLELAGFIPHPSSGAYTSILNVRGDGIHWAADYNIPMLRAFGNKADTLAVRWIDNSGLARDAEKAVEQSNYFVLNHEATNVNDISTYTTQTSLAIDSKIDDGNPVLGKVNNQLAGWGPGHVDYYACWAPEWPFNTTPQNVSYAKDGYCQPQIKAWEN